MKPASYAAYVLILVAGLACTKRDTNEKIKPTRDNQVFTVDLRVIPQGNITAICENLGVQYESNGCSTFDTVSKVCTIYVESPTEVYDTERMAIAGHELWHCRFGKFHE